MNLVLLAAETAASNDSIVITGATVVAFVTAVGWTLKRLYNDKQKADAAHVACEERRAQEAIQRAKDLEQALKDEREGRGE